MIGTKMSLRVGQIARACIALSLLASVAVGVKAQTTPKPYVPWVAPPEARAVKNPLKKTPDVLAAGQETFKENCEVCHGPKGDGAGPTAKTLTIKPANFTDAKLMAAETDGSLFWKMSKGRGAMPSWEDQFSETERWQLVIYIKAFGAKKAAE
ncbi:MAG: cytochrome c [Candidatus Acidiferrales bacterium]|jgi:mono/diheme cytochrome c family protein